MELVSDYMREDTMRHALNELQEKHSSSILKTG